MSKPPKESEQVTASSPADDLAGLGPRSSKKVPMLDQPPLGHLQAVVLKTFVMLGPKASGQAVLTALSKATGTWVVHAQVYGTIKKLREAGFVREVETVRQANKRGPPLKMLEVTQEGRSALAVAAEHYESVGRFLSQGDGASTGEEIAAVRDEKRRLHTRRLNRREYVSLLSELRTEIAEAEDHIKSKSPERYPRFFQGMFSVWKNTVKTLFLHLQDGVEIENLMEVEVLLEFRDTLYDVMALEEAGEEKGLVERWQGVASRLTGRDDELPDKH